MWVTGARKPRNTAVIRWSSCTKWPSLFDESRTMLCRTLPLFGSWSYNFNPKFPVKLPNIWTIAKLFIYFYRIRHFAGCVTYSVYGFMEKNRDTLPREVSRTMFRCDHPLMQSLFPEGNPKRCSVKRPVSVSVHLQVSLNALLKSLNNRQIHYVRCLKPNELKQPRIFELALIQHQVIFF